MSAKTYAVYNGPMPTTAALTKQPTGTAIRTMLQLAPGQCIRITEWEFSLDSYATPGIVELIDTGTVFATSLSAAFAVADVMPDNDPNAAANTSGTSGLPLNLGTGLSGYSTGSVTEGSITATKLKDCVLNPVGPICKQLPLGRESEVAAGDALRVRMTFGTSVNAIIKVTFETY